MGNLRFKDEEEFNQYMADRRANKLPAAEVPKPAKKRVNREEAAQIEVFQVLALNEPRYPFLKWIHASMNGATASSAGQAGKRRATGQKSGVADICIPYARREFHGAWLELKIAPNRLSPQQLDFLEVMSENGYAVKTCWSADDVFEFIEWYFQIKLAR